MASRKLMNLNEQEADKETRIRRRGISGNNEKGSTE
jgi:hypothetical protein